MSFECEYQIDFLCAVELKRTTLCNVFKLQTGYVIRAGYLVFKNELHNHWLNNCHLMEITIYFRFQWPRISSRIKDAETKVHELV